MPPRDEQIGAAVDLIDTRDSLAQDQAWVQLRPLGYGVVAHLRAALPRFSTWQGRTALVYYATRYARVSDDAFPLGLAGLTDKSYMVRYRACGLLAYGLREDAIPSLRRVATDDARELVAHSALAAINAILARNHNLFADRSLSGRTSWSVNPGDGHLAAPIPPLPSEAECQRLGIKPVPLASA